MRAEPRKGVTRMPEHKFRITRRTTLDQSTFTIQLDPYTAELPEKSFRTETEFRAMLTLCGIKEGAINSILQMLEFTIELNELGGQVSQDGVYALSLPNVT